MFARWEKRLLWGLALLLSVLLVFYALPRQKLLAARFREADRVILTNRIDRISATFVGDDVEKVIESLRGSKRVPPWYRVESTGGYRFEFFRGSKHVGSVEAGWGVFWIGGTTYVETTSGLDGVFHRLRSEGIQARENDIRVPLRPQNRDTNCHIVASVPRPCCF